MISPVCERKDIQDHLCDTQGCRCFCHTQKNMRQMRDEESNLIKVYAQTRSMLFRVWEEAEMHDNVLSEDTMSDVYDFLDKYRHQNEAWS